MTFTFGNTTILPPNIVLNEGEGSWMPTLSFATPGDLSVSYSSQLGFYRKVGKDVRIYGTLICTPTFTTGAGNIQIGGLPFVAQNVASLAPILPTTLGGSLAWNSYTQIHFAVQSSGTIMIPTGFRSGGTSGTLTAAQLTSGSQFTLRFDGIYRSLN